MQHPSPPQVGCWCPSRPPAIARRLMENRNAPHWDSGRFPTGSCQSTASSLPERQEPTGRPHLTFLRPLWRREPYLRSRRLKIHHRTSWPLQLFRRRLSPRQVCRATQGPYFHHRKLQELCSLDWNPPLSRLATRLLGRGIVCPAASTINCAEFVCRVRKNLAMGI